MSFTLIIPARLGSTRLAEKMLAEVAGKPLVQHTWERALQTQASQVVLAVDSEPLMQLARDIGAKAVLTDPALLSGTERCCAAAAELGLSDTDIVVNMQGDEPLLPLDAINSSAELARTQSQGIGTAAVPLVSDAEIHSPNVVKVVRSEVTGEGIYFSRSPIPFDRERGVPSPQWRHLGVYAMTYAVMKKVVALPPSKLELQESLEQLRAIENGVRLYVACIDDDPGIAVDTAEDLEELRKALRKVLREALS